MWSVLSARTQEQWRIWQVSAPRCPGPVINTHLEQRPQLLLAEGPALRRRVVHDGGGQALLGQLPLVHLGRGRDNTMLVTRETREGESVGQRVGREVGKWVCRWMRGWGRGVLRVSGCGDVSNRGSAGVGLWGHVEV